jgi:hypothetical protein
MDVGDLSSREQKLMEKVEKFGNESVPKVLPQTICFAKNLCIYSLRSK